MVTSRRTFLGGSAVAVGGLMVADKLRFLSPVTEGTAPFEGETEVSGSALAGPVFTATQGEHGKKSVWIAPYTGSLALIEGVIGASAGDSEGDNEGDSATPAGWNYVLVDPTNPANGGGFFTGHESVDFLNAKAIVFWANNVAGRAR